MNLASFSRGFLSRFLGGFASQLDTINALADRSPGFVWRLQTEGGDATEIDIFGDPELSVNMSVWESMEALFDYVYRSAHSQPLGNRKDWFLPMARSHLALWWIEAPSRPTIGDAEERLLLIEKNGPTSAAFTFKQPYPPPTGGSRARGNSSP